MSVNPVAVAYIKGVLRCESARLRSIPSCEHKSFAKGTLPVHMAKVRAVVPFGKEALDEIIVAVLAALTLIE